MKLHRRTVLVQKLYGFLLGRDDHTPLYLRYKILCRIFLAAIHDHRCHLIAVFIRGLDQNGERKTVNRFSKTQIKYSKCEYAIITGFCRILHRSVVQYRCKSGSVCRHISWKHDNVQKTRAYNPIWYQSHQNSRSERSCRNQAP